MSLSLLAAAALSAAAAPPPSCLTSAAGYDVARVEDPARNLSVLVGPRRMSDVCAAGAVVTNGTFFGAAAPLGDVIVDGAVVRSPSGGARRFKRDGRWIDLGRRWGVGVLKASGRLAVADGDDALVTMRTYLGGGGLLLKGGAESADEGEPAAGQWGASFPDDILADRRGRVALGLAPGPDGKQTLLVVVTRDAGQDDVWSLARLLKSLGATDAVFYDGGGALGLAAGGRCLRLPSNPGEDLNPTHLVVKACR